MHPLTRGIHTSPTVPCVPYEKKGRALFCLVFPPLYSCHSIHSHTFSILTHTHTHLTQRKRKASTLSSKQHKKPHCSPSPVPLRALLATMPPPCHFFRAGNCRNGDRCHFYHEGFSEFMNQPDAHAASHFEEDVHTDDEDEDDHDEVLGYSFGHSTPSPITRNTINHDNKQDVDARTESTSRFSKPCRWYVAGYCLRGDQCWFSHDLSSSHSPDGVSSNFFQDEATSSSASVPRHEDDRKCAICLEVPTTFGLLGKRNTGSKRKKGKKRITRSTRAAHWTKQPAQHFQGKEGQRPFLSFTNDIKKSKVAISH